MKDETPLGPGRYAHLRANAAAQRQATVNRLTQAIAQLESEKRPITTFTIKEVSGLDYMSYYRNSEALALFRTHSTHLRKEREKEQANQRRSRRKAEKHGGALHQVKVEPRDPLLAYKKPDLVAKLRAIQRENDQTMQNYQALLQEHMRSATVIAKLESQLAEYKAFMQRFRSALSDEEHGLQH
jgi:putative heme degradation protein